MTGLNTAVRSGTAYGVKRELCSGFQNDFTSGGKRPSRWVTPGRRWQTTASLWPITSRQTKAIQLRRTPQTEIPRETAESVSCALTPTPCKAVAACVSLSVRNWLPQWSPRNTHGRRRQGFCLGRHGDLNCLDANQGNVLWSRNFVRDYGTQMNAWGMAAAPLVDGQKLILVVGGHPNAAVMALDQQTGQELWRSLEIGDPGYCPPSIIQTGQTRQLIIWLTDAISALDPENGRVLWRQDFAADQGMSIATPVFDPQRQLLFASSFYNGPIMLRLSTTDRKPICSGAATRERRKTRMVCTR